LSRVATLKPRHPRWQKTDDATELSEADSLRDIHDISLNLKISLDSEKSASKDGNSTAMRKHLEDAVQKLSRGDSTNRKDGSGENTEPTTGSSKWPSLHKRKQIIVIAVDSVQDADFVQIIKNIFEASSNDRSTGAIGFVLSTS
jgi:sucrose-phosphate synthase